MKIFASNVEPILEHELYNIEKSGNFDHIRIMPDVHTGASVVGFTGYFKDKLSPDVLGTDIGCGVYCICLGNIAIDFSKLDKVIKRFVPSGQEINSKQDKYHEDVKIHLDDLNCYNSLKNIHNLEKQMGTLGGGNHFISVEVDNEGNRYLLIHTGSRNLGKQIYDYYISKADEQKMLTGDILSEYLQDCAFACRWAASNRLTIATKILQEMNITVKRKKNLVIDCPHNFIEGSLVRKGAVKARGEVIIPLNMRDGSLLCLGRYNEDWNYSAPHGAGRCMSRAQAKKNISLEDYQASMEGIYTTSVNESTLDESPMAYKSSNDIIENIADSVQILEVLLPLYNYKASSER